MSAISEVSGQSPISPLPDPSSQETRDPRKAAEAFESFFLFYMLKVMRESVPKNGLLGEGPGKEIYTSLLDQQIADGIASRRGFGLSEMLLREMTATPAQNSDPSAQVAQIKSGENVTDEGMKPI